MVAEVDRDYIAARPAKAWTRLLTHTLLQGRPLTTGGRWLNPAILGQFAIAKRAPQLRGVEKPVFILGTGRSGTTILGKVLSMHIDAVWLNEPKALWYAIYPGEDIIGSYSRRQAAYILTADDATPATVRNAQRLYGYCLALTRGNRIVDKYPEMIFRIPFLQAIFPDAKFVFITRDGRDTALSIQKWSDDNRQLATGESHDWWGVDQRKWNLLVDQVVPRDELLAPQLRAIAALTAQRDMAAVEWIATMRQGLRVSAANPGLIQTIRYEDLVAKPRQILREIFSFCELSRDEVALRYAEQQLSPRQPKPPLKLDESIQPAFDRTMRELGYASEDAS